MSNKPERDPKTGQFLRNNQCARRHGAIQYWSTGKLPPGRKSQRLRAELRRIREGLEQSLSGNGKGVSVKEELLINQIVRCHGFALIFEEYLKEYGALNRTELRRNKVQFQPGFKMYLSLLSRQNHALLSLGLNEKERERLLSPLEIIQAEEAKEKESVS